KALVIERLEHDHARKKSFGHGRHTLAGAFLSWKVWVLCFVYFGFTVGNYGITFWLPQIIKETITKDPFRIGLLTMIPWGVAAISMVLVGRHSDVKGERRWHIAIAGAIGAIAYAVSAIP